MPRDYKVVVFPRGCSFRVASRGLVFVSATAAPAPHPCRFCTVAEQPIGCNRHRRTPNCPTSPSSRHVWTTRLPRLPAAGHMGRGDQCRGTRAAPTAPELRPATAAAAQTHPLQAPLPAASDASAASAGPAACAHINRVAPELTEVVPGVHPLLVAGRATGFILVPAGGAGAPPAGCRRRCDQGRHWRSDSPAGHSPGGACRGGEAAAGGVRSGK